MFRFLVKRVALLIVTLLVSSLVIFSGLWLSPGDPLTALTGPRILTSQAKEALRERYHLNGGFVDQYWSWFTGILHGDFGTSIDLRTSVKDVISARAPITIELIIYSSIIVLLIGVVMGVIAGLRQGGPIDTGIVAGASVLVAVPSFVAATLFLLIFSVQLNWLPALGEGTGLIDRISHLTLPAFALALPTVGLVTRMTRVSIAKEADAEHVQTAISRGIEFRLVLRRHILRNAAVPITTVAGVALISQFALSAVVEQAFGLNGLGSSLVVAAGSKDLPLVQGIAVVLVTAFVVCNMGVDLLYLALDPRMRSAGITA